MTSSGRQNKGWALITGASSGIGYCYARLLAEQGYPLVLVSNEEERINEVCSELSGRYGIETASVCLDLSQPDSARRLYDYCVGQGHEIGILINNAGVFFFNDLTEVSPGAVTTMINLHIGTTTLLCRYFGKAMKERGQGYILNMSSMSYAMPYPGISVYAASKSYLRNLSKALHDELYDHGIGVTAVCPGAVATDLYNLPGYYQRLALRLGIMMTPEQLARKGLRAMFSRRKCVVPGILNHIFLFLLAFLPSWAVRLVKRKAKFYRYGK